jgi:meso-butanediol dehydrogenase / (S,S)-butanediol dehydrogenase / diacetyl reductase
MGRLDGKVALITGAGSGIGAATARLFAREGARVCVADVRGTAAAEVAEGIGRTGGQAIAIEADVSVAAQAQAMVERSAAEFGALHILHNNAGVLRAGSVHDLPEDEWQRTLAVNLTGAFLCSKFAVPIIKRSGGGCILMTASSAALVAEKAIAAYCASKGGLLMLAKQMAVDYARDGIRVNCLCPGWIDTSFNDPVIESAAALTTAIDTWVPLGRQGTPEEVAYAALYLASDEAALVTGHALVADGGLTAQ